MTSGELRASLALAAVFALRMLGLFLVLPVFSLAAKDYAGGDDPALVGFAMGVYGLTQALLQWPFGLASDRFGRRRLIIVGLFVFLLGSVVAACADTVWGLVAGRALQGAGAISAAVTALLADQTRVQVRTKAMALVGISIGATFSLALILGPLLGAYLGLGGLFWLVAGLAIAAMAVVHWVVPSHPVSDDGVAALQHEVSQHSAPQRAAANRASVQPALELSLPSLLVGVFILHMVQMALWSGVPTLLERAGLVRAQHWQLYLPAVVMSIAFLGVVFSFERKGKPQTAMLFGVALMLLSQWALWWGDVLPADGVLWLLGFALFAFFCGFNALEALQPSLVSALADPAKRGSIMGMYSTLQSLGLFCGGVMGGVMVRWAGLSGLFLMTGALTLVWLVLLVCWKKRKN
ncbi:MFS transporter [Lampropedia puyangensis]|uniref:MFS transporter n=1 Tax=Lampropedia puyangensis TaxID=1330072 RepID=A0A4S8EWV4_9BURK|nr:MFS transporter [Lampropedia puyangensis]THT98770.1 MFS transporter [Lampropedia puyangensis]